MEENMLMTFLCPDTPRKRPQECLVANGRVAVIWWASLPPSRPPSTPGFLGTHGGAWCGWRGSSGQAGPPASPGTRHGEGWRRRAFRQEVQRRGGAVSISLPPPPGSLSGVAWGQKGVGIWQSESTSLYFPTLPLHLPPKEARLDILHPPPTPYPGHLTLRDMKFLSYCWCGRGLEICSFPGDEWYGRRAGSDEAKGWAPESYQTLRPCCNCKARCAGGWGRPRGSKLSRLLPGRWSQGE